MHYNRTVYSCDKYLSLAWGTYIIKWVLQASHGTVGQDTDRYILLMYLECIKHWYGQNQQCRDVFMDYFHAAPSPRSLQSGRIAFIYGSWLICNFDF